MVNIKMINERIELLANQSSSISSNLEAESLQQLESIQSLEKPIEKMWEDDILDEPHISFLIKQVEKKSPAEQTNHHIETVILEQMEKSTSESQNIIHYENAILEIQSDIIEKAEIGDYNIGINDEGDSYIRKNSLEIQDVDIIENTAGNHDSLQFALQTDADNSIFLTDLQDSKDLADESMVLENDLHEQSEYETENIGIGSINTFTDKIKEKSSEKGWIDPDNEVTLSGAFHEDSNLFSLLARKILIHKKEETNTDHGNRHQFAENPKIDFNATFSDDLIGRKMKPFNDKDTIGQSRKRRISSTESSFEVIPKKSHFGTTEQFKVLEIFKKKFIAKRHNHIKPLETKVGAGTELYEDERSEILKNSDIQECQFQPDSSITINSKAKGIQVNVQVPIHLEEKESDVSNSSIELIDPETKHIRTSKAEKLKLYDESATISSSSPNSSFSEKSSKGNFIGIYSSRPNRLYLEARFQETVDGS